MQMCFDRIVMRVPNQLFRNFFHRWRAFGKTTSIVFFIDLSRSVIMLFGARPNIHSNHVVNNEVKVLVSSLNNSTHQQHRLSMMIYSNKRSKRHIILIC